MANTYSHTWHSADGIVPSVPSNYPPLFPWLVGRTSALINVPAWKLLGPAEAITLSFAVVAGYILWRRAAARPARPSGDPAGAAVLLAAGEAV